MVGMGALIVPWSYQYANCTPRSPNAAGLEELVQHVVPRSELARLERRRKLVVVLLAPYAPSRAARRQSAGGRVVVSFQVPHLDHGRADGHVVLLLMRGYVPACDRRRCCRHDERTARVSILARP